MRSGRSNEDSVPGDITQQHDRVDVLVVGSLVVDISATHKPFAESGDVELKFGSSNPAQISQCVGGVAHNIALAAHYLGANVLLSSVVANDSAGTLLLHELEAETLNTSGVRTLNATDGVRTGQYVGNYDANGKLLFGMADVALMDHPSTQEPEYWTRLLNTTKPKWVVLDLCFPFDVITTITAQARKQKANILLEPVSAPRASVLLLALVKQQKSYPNHVFDIIAPNEIELASMYEAAEKAGALKVTNRNPCPDEEECYKLTSKLHPDVRDLAMKALKLLPFFPRIIITAGKSGCVVVDGNLENDHILAPMSMDSVKHRSTEQTAVGASERTSSNKVIAVFVEHFPPTKVLHKDQVKSVNGAGDTFVGALVAGLLKQSSKNTENKFSLTNPDLVADAQNAAALTLQHADAVSPELKSLQNE